MYKVYGDYDMSTEYELESFDSLNAAIRWAERYTRNDFGGYVVIDVISFHHNGNPCYHWRAEDEFAI